MSLFSLVSSQSASILSSDATRNLSLNSPSRVVFRRSYTNKRMKWMFATKHSRWKAFQTNGNGAEKQRWRKEWRSSNCPVKRIYSLISVRIGIAVVLLASRWLFYFAYDRQNVCRYNEVYSGYPFHGTAWAWEMN